MEDKVERIVYSHMLGLIVEYCVCDGYYTSVISQGGKTNHRESSGGHKLCVLVCVCVGGGANTFLKETLSTKATPQQSYKSDTVSLASIPRYVQPGNKATVTPSLCNMNI